MTTPWSRARACHPPPGLPEVGWIRPHSSLIRVVLPLPLGPSRPMIAPWAGKGSQSVEHRVVYHTPWLGFCISRMFSIVSVLPPLSVKPDWRLPAGRDPIAHSLVRIPPPQTKERASRAGDPVFIGRDKTAVGALGQNQMLLLQLPQRPLRMGGARIDRGGHGQIAYAGQTVTRLILPADDIHSYLGR